MVKRDLSHLNVNFDVHEPAEAIRFETFWIEKLGKRYIDVLKLDIEGHEIAALNGFGEALQNIKVIQFEFGGCNIDTRTFLKDFWKLLTSNGFEIFRITPFGISPLTEYNERDEHFGTTNYLAVSK